MVGNRDRGILSEADRAYLRGDAEFGSVQAERNARARIRDRIFESVHDLELLVEHLSTHDRELVFEKRMGNADGKETYDALVAALAFLYQGIEDTDLDFEEVLAEAINLAEAENDRAATVTLDRTFHALSADELLRKLRSGETLSLTEIAYLQQSDAVSQSELARYFSEDEDTVDDGRIQAKVTQF
jgi:DNA-binding transcriptional regulator YiaG